MGEQNTTGGVGGGTIRDGPDSFTPEPAYEPSRTTPHPPRFQGWAGLFVSERLDRIERRGPLRGPDPEEQPHERAEKERQQDGEGRDERVPVHQGGEQQGAQ